MPVRFDIVSQKFYSQYRNGEDWSLLQDDFSFWLLGSIVEKLKTVIEVKIQWAASGDSSDGFSGSGSTIQRTVGSFLDDGFSIGDEVIAYTASGSPTSPDILNGAIVLSVSDTLITFDTTLGVMSSNYSYIRIRGTSDLEGCVFKYGLIENTESTNYNSKIDQSEQAYTANGIVSAGLNVPVVMNEQSGNTIKSWHNGEARIEFDNTEDGGTIKKYIIEHEFYVLPHFLDGFLQAILAGTTPVLYSNNQSLKYVWEADFRKTVNNPNESKIAFVNDILGNTGFFNQNFNGFINKFTFSNLQITEVSSSNSSSAIIVGSKTRFNFDLDVVSGSFAGTEQVIVGVSYLPDSTEYTDPTKTVEENFMLDSKLTTVGAGAVSSSIVQDLVVTNNSGTLQVQVDFDYSSSQQAILDDTKYYVVWALIGSTVATFATDKSNQLDDRVPITIQAEKYVKNSDVPGLILTERIVNGFYRHYRDYLNAPIKTDLKGWIEDGYLWRVGFFKDGFVGSEIVSAKFRFVAYNEDIPNAFDIQTYTFDIASNSIIITNPSNPSFNVQVINIDGTRGYNLEPTDQFDFAKFNTLNYLDNEYNEMLIGVKLNWEEWLSLPGADSIFYDQNVQNNGLNKNSNRYNLQNGYVLKCFLDMGIKDSSGGVTNYIIASADLDVHTYDEDGNTPPDWTCDIQTTSADGLVSFGGQIKTDEDTRIIATFTPETYAAGLDYFALLRLDDQLGNEYSIRELSSMATVSTAFNPPSPVSELKPLPGETGSDITDTGAVITVECLIDYKKIQKGKCYRISARQWNEGIGQYPGDILQTEASIPITLSQAPYEPIQLT